MSQWWRLALNARKIIAIEPSADVIYRVIWVTYIQVRQHYYARLGTFRFRTHSDRFRTSRGGKCSNGLRLRSIRTDVGSRSIVPGRPVDRHCCFSRLLSRKRRRIPCGRQARRCTRHAGSSGSWCVGPLRLRWHCLFGSSTVGCDSSLRCRRSLNRERRCAKLPLLPREPKGSRRCCLTNRWSGRVRDKVPSSCAGARAACCCIVCLRSFRAAIH